ncbi:hypothetical protein J6590_057193 [Homalodisca vitripennis]|nr:hypothetical protein J6590_057193 [Homalodisca vitripennis]
MTEINAQNLPHGSRKDAAPTPNLTHPETPASSETTQSLWELPAFKSSQHLSFQSMGTSGLWDLLIPCEQPTSASPCQLQNSNLLNFFGAWWFLGIQVMLTTKEIRISPGVEVIVMNPSEDYRFKGDFRTTTNDQKAGCLQGTGSLRGHPSKQQPR